MQISNKNITLKVYNATGLEVFNTSTQDNQIKINLSGNPKGLFLLKVANNNKVKIHKPLLE